MLTLGSILKEMRRKNLQAIGELCTRVLWLDHGEVVAEGDPKEIIESYKEENNVNPVYPGPKGRGFFYL